MTNLPSNILPFPIHHASPTTVSQLPSAQPKVPRLPIIGGKGPTASEEYREHVATIVGTVIRCGRRKGRSLSSLQPQLRKWLIDLFDRDDPTAIMVHDWLTGNRRYLAHVIDRGEPDGRRTSAHSVDNGEGA
ncbi:hypothetical protein [Pararhizobium gei]|uniref:hypothetical protein n=1 Tax=Pararhizobium gei TaxID=1395951 RepID=UPI0023DC1AF2|nr:hypothetical protein [Rhizobium gei]